MKNKIDQSLAKLIKKKKRDDSNRIRNERGEITIIITVIPKAKKNTMNRYIPTNWTTSKKWTNFQKHRICQN